jgi:hypothetical protein
MRHLVNSFKLFAMINSFYLVIIFVPFTRYIIGSDGGWFFKLGFFLLAIVSAQALLLLSSNLRGEVFLSFHSKWDKLFGVGTLAFFLIGWFSVVSLYLNGV